MRKILGWIIIVSVIPLVSGVIACMGDPSSHPILGINNPFLIGLILGYIFEIGCVIIFGVFSFAAWLIDDL